MEFRTKVTVDTSRRGLLAHGDSNGIVTLGSCFSDNIAVRLRADLFTVNANPFGTLFNPLSIAAAVERLTDGKSFGAGELIKGPDGLFHSMMHHSRFSDADPAAALDKINSSLTRGRRALTEARVVFITLGSAFVYSYQGRVVANCHKLPASEFERRMITVEETAAALRQVSALLPGKEIVVTVSPVRHVADGLHANNLSKATLLLGAEASGLSYFPAYEALNDDLRDYRFYAADMRHPSDVAADYVYSLLTEAYMTDADRNMLPACRSFTSMCSHRPLDGDPDGQHRSAIQRRARQLVQAHPELETAITDYLYCNGILNI